MHSPRGLVRIFRFFHQKSRHDINKLKFSRNTKFSNLSSEEWSALEVQENAKTQSLKRPTKAAQLLFGGPTSDVSSIIFVAEALLTLIYVVIKFASMLLMSQVSALTKVVQKQVKKNVIVYQAAQLIFAEGTDKLQRKLTQPTLAPKAHCWKYYFHTRGISHRLLLLENQNLLMIYRAQSFRQFGASE